MPSKASPAPPSPLRVAVYTVAAAVVVVAIASSVLRLTGNRSAPAASAGDRSLDPTGAQPLRAPAPPNFFPRSGPTLAFQTKAPDQLQLKLSSAECDGAEDPLHEVCILHNMLIHQGDLIYVVQDDAAAAELRLPLPALHEVGNSPFQVTLAEHVVVATLPAVLDRLRKSAASAGKGDGLLKVTRFERAIFQRIRAFTNWFWALNGVGNVYHRLCKYMGACGRDAVQATAVLQMARRPVDNPWLKVGPPKDTYESVRELMLCFGPFIQVNHVAGDRSDMEADDRVLILERMLVGVGDEVLEPLSAKSADEEPQYRQANATMGLKRVEYLRQCAGLPAVPPPMRTPSVLLVNRPFDAGRHVIGLDDVYDRLRRRLPPEVPVTLYLPRIESLAAQAAMFASANVVVVPHGAGNANFLFLPRTAVVFGVYALTGRYALDRAHVQAMPTPPYNITIVPVDCSDRIEVRTDDVASAPGFAALSPAERAELLGGTSMHGAMTRLLDRLLGFTPLDWMDYASYAPDPEELANKVAEEVEHLLASPPCQ